MKVRTRFAPSPTGRIHLGNARTAVLNWLFARHHSGCFVLRFEDTDLGRNEPRSEAEIMEALDWLGLDRDEGPWAGGEFGPYRQSERLGAYRKQADRLLESGLAYRCYCRPEELEARRQAARGQGSAGRYDGRCRELTREEEDAYRSEGRRPVLRFRVEPGPVEFVDLIKGPVRLDGSDFGDMVIMRPDGLPTYNFAVVVDDAHMQISHVIRAVGHLANTPKQILLYAALGFVQPHFAHIPTVLAPGGGKLSKREGARGVLEYREEGYLADGVVNYLSLLSWSSPGGEEILTRKQLIGEIDLARMGVADPTLDPAKLRWVSGQHIRQGSEEVLAMQLTERPEVARLGLTEQELRAAAGLFHDRVSTLGEAEAELRDLFARAATEPGSAADTPPRLGAEHAGELLLRVASRWAAAADWNRGRLKADLIGVGRELGLRGASLFQPVRMALSGHVQGPDVAGLALVLGRERTLARLQAAGDGTVRVRSGS